MNMEKAAKEKICFILVFLAIVMVLVVSSIFFFLPDSQSSHFLFTVAILLLSSVILVIMTKKKGFPDENLVLDKEQKEELKQPSTDVTEKYDQQVELNSDSSLPVPSDTESSKGSTMGEISELNFLKHDQLQGNLESDSLLPSDSESSTGSMMDESSDSDLNRDQDLGVSDNEYDDDEDSLIEINLPIGDFPGLSEEPKQKLLSKLPDFLPESIFNQQGLVELLAEINEMNEDENLIEIDISMGSNKSQDLKLKQEVAVLGDL
ncbi:hypothetical protein L6164_029506 [Bauhinia variegata]|uniref:Uncharacterized protein n=1 Tax=Bauhinia variegata TaxID=167791 RepID=A0ACB9L9B5_BAUVA|nr:hypothetical protein L6164_029506 [Bauhinia variegata]